MRTPVLLLAALVLAACGKDRRATSSEPGTASQTNRGPDAVLLRVPRGGGPVVAYVYPRLDSAVWRSRESAPPIARVLAFDREGGQLAALDTGDVPLRLDLRLGTVRRASTTPLAAAASLNGIDIFGVANDGAVTRVTPSGSAWSVRLPGRVQAIEPLRDGTVLVAASRGGTWVVSRFRPPGTRVTDSAVVSAGGRVLDALTPERMFFSAGSTIAGVQTRTLQPLQAVELDAPPRVLAATPSGDRFYAALEGRNALSVLDRYSNTVAARIELPAPATDLRMDPRGRYVLARAGRGDSAWVVAVGTDRVLGSVRTAWRSDLPLVLPDGAILTAVGDDVVVIDGARLAPSRTITGGGSDLWHLVVWNGFRPRAKGLDQPVEFQSDAPADSTPMDSAAADSALAPPDTAVPATPPDTSRDAESDSGVRLAHAAATGRGYTVQFMAASSERDARLVLARMRLPDGVKARIVPGQRNRRPVYRVVAGPFATRARAERVGRASGRDYWIYEGAP